MTRDELREKIAAEAARLMLRGKEQDFSAARKRAARWLKRRRLHRDEVPSNQEIQVQLYALSGLMASETDPMQRAQLRHWVCQLLTVLEPSPAAWIDTITAAQIAAGTELQVEVCGDRSEIQARLNEAGFSARPVWLADSAGDLPGRILWRLRVAGQFPCEILGVDSISTTGTDGRILTLADVREQLQSEPAAAYEPADDEHPDAFAVFEMLLAPLARVQWPASAHPEGDALYHSLQVFELGRREHPYDEEFLLACLLHDVGYGINPRHPVLAAVDALGSLITERTRFLIEQRPVASRYLLTGDCPRSLRKHPDFDDLVLLARCDRDGRVPGETVCDLDEALSYLAGLDTAWDDEVDGDPDDIATEDF